MPECKNPLREELKAYLDNELPALRRGAVARHLEQCPHCKEELAALQRLTQTLASLPAPEPLSPALRARILAQLPQSAVSVAPVRPFWRRPGPLAGGGSILALACAVLFWARTPAPETASATLGTKTFSMPRQAISLPVAAVVPAESKAAQPMASPAPPAKKESEKVENTERPTSTGQATDNFYAVAPKSRLLDSPKDAAQAKVDTAPLAAAPSAAPPMVMKAEVTAKKKVLSATVGTGRGVPGGTFGARGGGGGAMPGGTDGATFATGRVIPTPLTLTVAAGKAEETMTELRRLAKEQGATEPEPDPKQALLPRQLVFLLPADKAAAFRATLEKQGKVSEPSAAFVTKKDMSPPSDPQTFVITIAEENPADS